MKTLKINLEDLSKSTNTPIFAYCRKLVKQGEPEDSRLEVFRKMKEPDVIIPHIGRASKLTVKEEPNLHFTKYIDKFSKIATKGLS